MGATICAALVSVAGAALCAALISVTGAASEGSWTDSVSGIIKSITHGGRNRVLNVEPAGTGQEMVHIADAPAPISPSARPLNAPVSGTHTSASLDRPAVQNNSGLTRVTPPGSTTARGGDVFNKAPRASATVEGNGPSSVGNAYNGASFGAAYIGSTNASNGNANLANASLPIASDTAMQSRSMNLTAGATSAGTWTYDGSGAIKTITHSDSGWVLEVNVSGPALEVAGVATSSASALPLNDPVDDGDYTITAIYSGAFLQNLTDLTGITIPGSVASIGAGTFNGCVNLTSVTIENGVGSIGIQAFYACTSLTSVTIPASVISIDNMAFQGCSDLASVTIPGSVTTLGAEAFAYCTSLTSVFFEGDCPPTVGSNIYYFNTLTTYIYNAYAASWNASPDISGGPVLGSASATWKEQSIRLIDPPGWTYDSASFTLTHNDTGWVLSVTANGTDLNIYSVDTAPVGLSALPLGDAVDGGAFAITSIGNGAFFNCAELESVVIGNSVTNIANGAFNGCANLASVAFGNGVANIGVQAFYGCSSLTSVTIPDSVISIGNMAFEGCAALASVTIPGSVASIGGSAFANCTSLASVTIPASVTDLGTTVFYFCNSLTSVTFNGNCPSGGTDLYLGAPNAVTYIYNTYAASWNASSDILNGPVLGGASATWKGRSIRLIDTPSFSGWIYNGGNTLTHSGNDWVLSVTRSGMDLNIDGVVTAPAAPAAPAALPLNNAVNNGAFAITSIGTGAFLKCEELASVVMGDSVTNIDASAFAQCSNLVSVAFGSSVENIGNNAFDHCVSLTDVTIPVSVTSLGIAVFSWCENLTSVTFAGNCPSGGTQTYYGASAGVTTYIYSENVSSWIADLDAASPPIDSGQAMWRERLIQLTTPLVFDGWVFNRSDPYTGTLTHSDNGWVLNVLHSGTNLAIVSTNTVPENPSALPLGDAVNNGAFAITAIGTGAFLDCTNLASVVIGNSVTNIADGAFNGCVNLENAVIGNSVVDITGRMFFNCPSLENVVIGNSVTNIGYQAFLGCVNLTSVTLPGSVKTIGQQAFENCGRLEGVTISAGVESIGTNAFANCVSLTILTIPDTVTSLGSAVFLNCTGLTDVTFEGNCPSLPSGTTDIYAGADSVTTYVYNDNADNWNENVDNPINLLEHNNAQWQGRPIKLTTQESFSGWTYLSGVSDLGGAIHTITHSSGWKLVVSHSGKELTILSVATIGSSDLPLADSVRGGFEIVTIADSAFEKCLALESVTIPASVTTLGESAFDGCANLENVSLGSGIKHIGVNAFVRCESLTDLIIPSTVETIGNNAFEFCFALERVDIPDTVTYLGGSAFAHCSNLVSVVIGDGVDNIGDSAFAHCANLDDLTIGSGVESIGANAFYSCPSLTSVTIPGNVETIGTLAFGECSSLTSLTIAEGVADIGFNAFANCDALTSVTIPASVTHIGHGAFAFCESLTRVTFEGECPDVTDDNGHYSDVYYNSPNVTNYIRVAYVENWNTGRDDGSPLIETTKALWEERPIFWILEGDEDDPRGPLPQPIITCIRKFDDYANITGAGCTNVYATYILVGTYDLNDRFESTELRAVRPTDLPYPITNGVWEIKGFETDDTMHQFFRIRAYMEKLPNEL